MKRNAIVAISLVVVAAGAAALTLLYRPPAALVGPRVNAWLVGQAKGMGRDLTIGGQTSVSFLPRFRLRLNDVALSGPDGRPGEPLIKAKGIEVHGNFRALLQGGRDFDSVRVEDAVVNLAVDAKGAGNWEFASAGANAFTIASLEVARGNLAYTDARSGAGMKAAAVDGSFTGVTRDAVGAFTVKTGAAVLDAASSGGATVGFAADKTSIAGEALKVDGVARVTFGAGQLVARTSDGAVAATLDGLSVGGTKVTRDTIDALTLKADAVRLGTSSGGIVAARLVDMSANAIAANRIGPMTLSADRLGIVEGEGRPSFELAKVEAKSPGGAFDGPFASDIAFDWNRERVTGSVKLASFDALNTTKPVPVVVTLNARDSTFTLDGTLNAGGEVEGKAGLTSKSLRSLTGWLGVELPKSGAFAVTRLDGRIVAKGKRITVSDAELQLDATKAKGGLVVDMSGLRPKLSGTLAADRFDADAYGLGKAPPKREVAPAAAAAMAEAPLEPPPVSLKDALKVYLLKQLQALEQPAARAVSADPTVEELTSGPEEIEGPASATAEARPKKSAPEPWSNAPMDFSALRTVDLDMALSVGKLTWSGIDIAAPDVKAVLDDGALAVETKNLEVKGGKVTGRASVDARAAKPTLATTLKAENVETTEIFGALGITDYVAGKSVIEADLKGSAASQKDLVETVSGGVKMKMSKGAIVGYDFSDVIGGFFEWLGGTLRYDPKRRSPFDKLEADMKLTNGLAKTNAMKVDGPVISLTSDGTAKLPAREIDYRARVSLAAWFKPIAVRIFGDWQKPSKAVDVFDFSRNPGVLASPLDAFRKTDLKDPELAALAGALLEKSETAGRPLPDHVKQLIAGIKARAEGKE